jgi:hypothetical protein
VDLTFKRKKQGSKGGSRGRKVGKTAKKRKKRSDAGVKKGSNVRVLELERICDIIDKCAERSVFSFQFADLRITFKEHQNQSESLAKPGVAAPGAVERAERSASLQETDDLYSHELEFLKITDPVAYENYIQSEDVADDAGN